MGIETSPPDVEESTEPPLRPPPATLAEGTPGLIRDHPNITGSYSPEDKSKIKEHNSISVFATPTASTTSFEPNTEKGNFTLTDTLGWGEEYKYAHTYPIPQISNVLAVDIQ
jgi:hypothetical protein